MENKSNELQKIDREQHKVIAIILDCIDHDLPELEEEMKNELHLLVEKQWEQKLAERKAASPSLYCELPPVFGKPDNSRFFKIEVEIMVGEGFLKRISDKLMEIKNREPDFLPNDLQRHSMLMDFFCKMADELQKLRATLFQKGGHQ